MLFCLALQTTTFGQSDNAQISGFIKDPTGAAVPGASVVIKNEVSNYERTAKTNDSGYYIITALPPGFYTVTVEAGGFKKFQQTKKKLDPSIATTVDAELTLGEVTETIEVVASVSSVQSETATVGKLIESSQIALMQLNGRNPVLLAGLKPGVRSGSNLSGLNFGLTSGGFNINGGRSQDNLITYDGAVGIRTRSNGTSIGTADVDAVQEVQILTANYGAEYGRSGGGQIRVVTKSGTQDFHGTVYEFLRNSALDANSWSRNRTHWEHCSEQQARGPAIQPVWLLSKWSHPDSWLQEQALLALWSGVCETSTGRNQHYHSSIPWHAPRRLQ